MGSKLYKILAGVILAGATALASTTKIEPTAIDGNRDGRDDNWTVRSNIANPNALFIPKTLIPSSWYQNPRALWVSDNTGGGADADYIFSRTIIVPETANTKSVRLGVEFSASGYTVLLVNGEAVKVFEGITPDTRVFYEVQEEGVFKHGDNKIEFRVRGNAGRLVGFMLVDGFINYSEAEGDDRTLRDYRRKGGRF